MKKVILPILFLQILQFAAFSQITVDVAEGTLKISGHKEEIFYYGFAEGDQIIFNFEEVNKKEVKEVEIIELPSNSKFMDYKTKKIENRILNVTRTGVYKFRFSNTALLGKICKFKIQRIATEKTKNFNSSVYWRDVVDTIYSTAQETHVIKSDTTFQDFYTGSPQVSSKHALNGNPNSQIIDLDLPDNTILWSFYIGTGKKGQEEFENAMNNFKKNTAIIFSNIPGYGAMAELALFGISYFNKIQGGDNVKYWFLTDANSITQFHNKQPFTHYKMGDVINEASQMKTPLKGKVYLALMNDNIIEPITITIKATAVIVNNKSEIKMIKKMNFSSRQEPYLKN